MSILFLIILTSLIVGIIWCLPVYLVINLVCWLFSIPFHLSIPQAFGICLLAYIIRRLLFGKKDISFEFKSSNENNKEEE